MYSPKQLLVHVTGGSVLLESRPDDIAIDMNQLSQQQRQDQQYMLDEQVVNILCGTCLANGVHPAGSLHPRKSRDNGKHRIHHCGARRDIQTTS